MTPNLIVVMSQGDIVKKQAADRADWEKRGITGAVTAVSAGHIAISAPSASGRISITIAFAHNTIVRRYAPDSVRVADAKPAKFADIRLGDQLRVRGEKKDDKVIADEVVFGTFKTVGARVTAINAQAASFGSPTSNRKNR